MLGFSFNPKCKIGWLPGHLDSVSTPLRVASVNTVLKLFTEV